MVGHVFLLRQMKFTHGFVDQHIVDFFYVARGGMNQAGCGHIVDLPANASGVVMNQVLGLGLEGLAGSTGQGNAVVDISTGLFLGERMQGKPEAYSLNQIGVRGALEDLLQVLLPAQDDFQRYLLIDGGHLPISRRL